MNTSLQHNLPGRMLRKALQIRRDLISDYLSIQDGLAGDVHADVDWYAQIITWPLPARAEWRRLGEEFLRAARYAYRFWSDRVIPPGMTEADVYAGDEAGADLVELAHAHENDTDTESRGAAQAILYWKKLPAAARPEIHKEIVCILAREMHPEKFRDGTMIWTDEMPQYAASNDPRNLPRGTFPLLLEKIYALMAWPFRGIAPESRQRTV